MTVTKFGLALSSKNRIKDKTGGPCTLQRRNNALYIAEIINGESIPIYFFIVLKIFNYDGLSRGNCCFWEHIKDGPCFNGATSAQNCS
ncbi:hypothetical protein TNCV_262871 [Trichonephila clavipes]|nr:hypothetical protein TNCV_262871 [Trichonephila clavipes]